MLNPSGSTWAPSMGNPRKAESSKWNLRRISLLLPRTSITLVVNRLSKWVCHSEMRNKSASQNHLGIQNIQPHLWGGLGNTLPIVVHCPQRLHVCIMKTYGLFLRTGTPHHPSP